MAPQTQSAAQASKRLTRSQIVRAAMDHAIEPAALQAVITVESGGSGFLPDGRPKILLERHLLWKRLASRGINPRALAGEHPELCGQKWDRRYYKGGIYEWARVDAVIKFGDRDENRAESYRKAAWEACSWGMFQLLGQNYEGAGFPNVLKFVEAHETSEAEQLAAILRWMNGNGLLKKLAARNWIAFTAGYNGPGQVPIYSARLLAAYHRHRKSG